MAKLNERGERSIVSELLGRLDPGGWLMMGDDCALLDMGEHYLLATTDMINGRTHIPDGARPEDVGWYAAAVNLSDIAAMGGEPLGMMFALGLPPETEVGWLEALMSGIGECADSFSAPVLGGDTKVNPAVTISGVALGRVAKDRTLFRKGARPGDLLVMTGALGRGLLWERDRANAEMLLRVQPRVREGMKLARSGIATSCIDISDGLSTCLHLMSQAGKVGFTVDAEKIPMMPGLKRDELESALHWGGDFELLFTISPEKQERLGYCLFAGTTVIGKVTESPDIIIYLDGKREQLPDKGYEHFMREG